MKSNLTQIETIELIKSKEKFESEVDFLKKKLYKDIDILEEKILTLIEIVQELEKRNEKQ